MTRLSKSLLLTVFVITVIGQFLVFEQKMALACSCAVGVSFEESFDMTEAVFAGQVVDIDMPRGLISSSADPVKVTFDVSQTWKGITDKIVSVYTARDSASCGYNFQQGQEYLVFARGDDRGLTVNLCGRTAVIDQAGADLAALGQGDTNLREDAKFYENPTERSKVVLVAATFIASLILTKYLLVRKLRSPRA